MHGGDIYRNMVESDFSVNISPAGIPESVAQALKKALSSVDRYPDIHCEELKSLLSVKHGIPKTRIVCGNGASELIMGIAHAVRPADALLIAPGFSGYEHALRAVKAKISYHYLKEDNGFETGDDMIAVLKEKRPEIFFITNPNNPTGRTLSGDRIEKLVKVCLEMDALVVIDECFMELTGQEDDCSFVSKLDQYKNTVILRAFTKSFGIPGVRLGYCLCSDAGFSEKIKEQLPEWNVSVPAQYAGAAALKEKDDMRNVRKVIREEREYLVRELTELGIKVYPSDTNFLLFYDDRSWYDLLLKEKILIRDCSDYEGLEKGFYRIAVKQHSENQRLIEKMKRIAGRR